MDCKAVKYLGFYQAFYILTKILWSMSTTSCPSRGPRMTIDVKNWSRHKPWLMTFQHHVRNNFFSDSIQYLHSPLQLNSADHVNPTFLPCKSYFSCTYFSARVMETLKSSQTWMSVLQIIVSAQVKSVLMVSGWGVHHQPTPHTPLPTMETHTFTQPWEREVKQRPSTTWKCPFSTTVRSISL